MDLKYPLSSKMKAGDKAMDRNGERDTKSLKTWAFYVSFCHVTVTLFFFL